MSIKNFSVCGVNCDVCKFFLENDCKGCRNLQGKIFWGNGETYDLYKCCSEKKHDNCGRCNEFPCDKLQEWATVENDERIQNLIEENLIEHNKKIISVCGTYCAECEFKSEKGCKGCKINKGNPFWGECDLYPCCNGKGYDNCGECKEFPCNKLIIAVRGEDPGMDSIKNLIELYGGGIEDG